MPYIGPVEHNIPIPEDGRRRTSPIRERLKELKPGDSFVTSFCYSHVHTYAARLGFTVATKYESEGKIRVWKLKDKLKK